MNGRQSYNAQAAVDGAHQIIVASTLSDNARDQGELVRLVEAIKSKTGADAVPVQ